jgi:hypothetical protein
MVLNWVGNCRVSIHFTVKKMGSGKKAAEKIARENKITHKQIHKLTGLYPAAL